MAVHEKDPNQVVIERAKDFWTRYNKPLTIVAAVIILVGGGWLGYKKLYKEPREKKAVDAMFRAEEIFQGALFTDKPDSIINLALNGSGTAPGFLKVIKDYSGTKQANLAKFYAGNCYIMLNDNAKALKYLEGFTTDSKIFQARAWKMLGDIYADQGKNKDAFNYYKKAAHHFPENNEDASEYLWMAAYFAEKVLNDKQQAIELYKELKTDFPETRRGAEADKYLARLGVITND
jgi:predicted negative regulator of RcsB-dependent stress response